MSRPKLSEALFVVLEREMARGPVAHSWPDQTWTLSRIKILIGRRFHKSMALSRSRRCCTGRASATRFRPAARWRATRKP
ncbi:hypothetical protein SNL152K_4918 [Streptomyces sp. NL15-2K]|nr:hypothetical protein SNL152K_4918 [Streptomyces sp. NL15-2K]